MFAQDWPGDKHRNRSIILLVNGAGSIIGLALRGFVKGSGMRHFGVFLATSMTNSSVTACMTWQSNNIQDNGSKRCPAPSWSGRGHRKHGRQSGLSESGCAGLFPRHLCHHHVSGSSSMGADSRTDSGRKGVRYHRCSDGTVDSVLHLRQLRSRSECEGAGRVSGYPVYAVMRWVVF